MPQQVGAAHVLIDIVPATLDLAGNEVTAHSRFTDLGGDSLTAVPPGNTLRHASAPPGSGGALPGTHQADLSRGRTAGIDLTATRGSWYREIGQGMGAAINTASGMNGFVFAARATWLSFRNRGDLDLLVEGVRRLFHQYGIMLVNPAKHPSVKKELGQQFIDWLVSAEDEEKPAMPRRHAGSERICSPMRPSTVVPGAGIEPARLAAGDFESPASTNFTTRAEYVKP